MAKLQVSAGASRILLGSLGAADVLNLVVERLERRVNLSVMLTEVSGSLVGPHVPERIGALLSLTETSESGHVNAWTRWTRRTGGSRVSRGTLRGCKKNAMIAMFRSFFFGIIAVALIIPLSPFSSLTMCQSSVMISVLISHFVSSSFSTFVEC